MVGAILAVAGAVMSGVQAYQANQKKKAAENSAKVLANQAKNLKTSGSSTPLQVGKTPYELAMMYNAQAAQSALGAVGTSAEGTIGGVPAIVNQLQQGNLEQSAALSAEQSRIDIERARINEIRDAEERQRQLDIFDAERASKEAEAADAEAARNAAIQSAVSGAGSALEQSMPAGGDYKRGVSKDSFKTAYNKKPTKPVDPNIAKGNYGQEIDSNQLVGGVDWSMFGNSSNAPVNLNQ